MPLSLKKLPRIGNCPVYLLETASHMSALLKHNSTQIHRTHPPKLSYHNLPNRSRKSNNHTHLSLTSNIIASSFVRWFHHVAIRSFCKSIDIYKWSKKNTANSSKVRNSTLALHATSTVAFSVSMAITSHRVHKKSCFNKYHKPSLLGVCLVGVFIASMSESRTKTQKIKGNWSPTKRIQAKIQLCHCFVEINNG